MDWMKISKAKRDAVRAQVKTQNVATCPNCEKLMAVITNQSIPKRPEAYCEDCHLSVPLFTVVGV